MTDWRLSRKLAQQCQGSRNCPYPPLPDCGMCAVHHDPVLEQKRRSKRQIGKWRRAQLVIAFGGAG